MRPEPSSPGVDAAVNRLPRHTTPTWEVELLISGVAVFAMLQLPGWLDDKALAMLPRFDARWLLPLTMVYLYLKAAAILLAVTFALHLLLRAQWIARVGVHSVYPDGVRWENLRMGPVQRETEKRINGDAAAGIERADNRATTVFAIGVTLASVLLIVALLFVSLVGVVTGVVTVFGWPLSEDWIMLGCMAALIGPLLLLNALDRWVGPRLRPGGRAWRWLAVGQGFSIRSGLAHASGITALISSHGGENRFRLLTIAIMLVVMFAAVFSFVSQGSGYPLGSYALFPHFAEDSGQRLQAAHYADQRGTLEGLTQPYVQSAVIDGPYLRLVVPYVPRSDGAVLRRDCAAARLPHHDDARSQALLQCLARLHAVTLDGKALSAAYAVGSDGAGTPALVAMIDVRGLSPGRHQLRVAHAPDDSALADEDAPSSDLISFWR